MVTRMNLGLLPCWFAFTSSSGGTQKANTRVPKAAASSASNTLAVLLLSGLQHVSGFCRAHRRQVAELHLVRPLGCTRSCVAQTGASTLLASDWCWGEKAMAFFCFSEIETDFSPEDWISSRYRLKSCAELSLKGRHRSIETDFKEEE